MTVGAAGEAERRKKGEREVLFCNNNNSVFTSALSGPLPGSGALCTPAQAARVS